MGFEPTARMNDRRFSRPFVFHAFRHISRWFFMAQGLVRETPYFFTARLASREGCRNHLRHKQNPDQTRSHTERCLRKRKSTVRKFRLAPSGTSNPGHSTLRIADHLNTNP